MITMAQKVGGAILLAEVQWSPKSGVSKEVALGVAALEAMRDPTEAMAEAADAFLTTDYRVTYTAMIDAALEETK